MRIEVSHPIEHVARRQVAEWNTHAGLSTHLDQRVDWIANDAVRIVLVPVADVGVPAAQIEPIAEHDRLVFLFVANACRERRAERVAEHPLH